MSHSLVYSEHFTIAGRGEAPGAARSRDLRSDGLGRATGVKILVTQPLRVLNPLPHTAEANERPGASDGRQISSVSIPKVTPLPPWQ